MAKVVRRADSASVWSAAERRAWRPPNRQRPSEWAERYRVLARQQSARPGPWRNGAAPYLVGIMDLIAGGGHEEVTIVKAAQVGASEAVRNVIAWLADCEPDPVMLVLPSEDVGKKIMRRRVIPLMRDTPRLAVLLTDRSHDVALHSVTLANGFCVTLAWSGSPASLASDPVRLVVNDELDKFTAWSGKEADAVSLARARTVTFGTRRRVVNISTPTTRAGQIWSLWEQASVRLRYFVPCRECKRMQWLTFDRLRWSQPPGEQPGERAAWLESHGEVWYECAHCGCHWSEAQRAAAVRLGRWLPEGEGVFAAADETALPDAKRIALHLSALVCLWIPWRAIACEHLRSLGSPALRQNFANSWLGEVFEEQVERSPEPVFARKCCGAAPRNIVPNWATVLLGSADVQQDRIYWVVRAWGVGYRSRRIAHGVAFSFDELHDVILRRRFPWDDKTIAPGAVAILGCDAGYRSQEVYRFALANPTLVRALRGENEPTPHQIRLTRVTYRAPGEAGGEHEVWLHRIDTNHYKDRLAALIREQRNGEDVWQLNDENDRDYNLQLASEHKVLIRSGRRGPVSRWQQVTGGAANHYFDCEVYQLALADMARVDLIRLDWPGSAGAAMQAASATPQRPVYAPPVRRAPIRRNYG